MESNKYFNVHPISIDKQTNKNQWNKLNQEYMFEYWVHVDSHEVASFGTKTSIKEQNKMIKLLYSMYSINDEHFGGSNVLNCKTFESLCYNGNYIKDTKDYTSNSCKNNQLIKIPDDKTIYHQYCGYIKENEMIKQLGFMSQRPIQLFDLNKLF